MPGNKDAERHLIVEFNCLTEHVEKVKSLLGGFIGPARQEPGCLYYDLYQTRDNPGRFYILDGWADEAAVKAHGNHPNVAKVLKDLLPLLSAPPSIVTSDRVSD